MADLSCYRIRDAVGSDPKTEFDTLVDLDNRSPATSGPVEGDGFAAKLYVLSAPPHRPRWAGLLEDGFDPQPGIPDVASVSALLLVRLDDPVQFFAFPFGVIGRHLLRPGVAERSYGLKAALNLLFAKEAIAAGNDASRVRSVDTKRVAQTTVRTRRQTSLESALEEFGIDRLRDMLRSITARPADTKLWGSRVVGADHLRLAHTVEFRKLGTLCQQVEKAARRGDYREHCRWIDDLTFVAEADERDRVREAVADTLKSGDPDRAFELSPPEIVDWDQIVDFQFHFERRGKQKATHPTFELHAFLRGKDVRDKLDYEYLVRKRLYSLGGDGREVDSWPVWNCLTGAIEVDGTHYVVDDGEIYVVAADYLAALDQDIDAVPECSLALPSSLSKWKEPEYNEEAARRTEGVLKLDGITLLPPGATTPIEVCDLLSSAGQLVHVKRHFRSSGLSHLFNQGLVSAETLVRHPDFRSDVQEKVTEVGGSGFDSVFDVDSFAAARHEVTFAIVAGWAGRSASRALPFFSKLTLRHVYTELQHLGFSVSLAPIDRIAASSLD